MLAVTMWLPRASFPAPTPLAPQRGRLPWRLRRRDRDERAECHVGPNSFRRSPRELNAPETLLRPVAIAGEVVNRLATVEIRDPGDRVRVLGAVWVSALHDLMPVPDIHRVSPHRRRRGWNAGIRQVLEDPDAVMPDGQRLRRLLVRQRVCVTVLVRLVVCGSVEQGAPESMADRPAESQPLLILVDHVRGQPVISLERHHGAEEYLAGLGGPP